MANTTKPTDLTVFDLLEALTGELPCYASPNWNVSDKKDEQPTHSLSSAEDQSWESFWLVAGAAGMSWTMDHPCNLEPIVD